MQIKEQKNNLIRIKQKDFHDRELKINKDFIQDFNSLPKDQQKILLRKQK